MALTYNQICLKYRKMDGEVFPISRLMFPRGISPTSIMLCIGSSSGDLFLWTNLLGHLLFIPNSLKIDIMFNMIVS